MKNFKSITTLLLVVALLASCSGKNDKKGDKMKNETPLVQVQSVFAENVDETSEYTATVEAFKTNYITSNSGNRIKRILVDVGSRVSAGQSLVILDNVTSVNQESAIAGQRAAVANQGASLASQEAALKTEEINLARQKKDLDRAKELVRIGGGTQQAVDQLQAAYDAALESLKAGKLDPQLKILREEITANEKQAVISEMAARKFIDDVINFFESNDKKGKRKK